MAESKEPYDGVPLPKISTTGSLVKQDSLTSRSCKSPPSSMSPTALSPNNGSPWPDMSLMRATLSCPDFYSCYSTSGSPRQDLNKEGVPNIGSPPPAKSGILDDVEYDSSDLDDDPSRQRSPVPKITIESHEDKTIKVKKRFQKRREPSSAKTMSDSWASRDHGDAPEVCSSFVRPLVYPASPSSDHRRSIRTKDGDINEIAVKEPSSSTSHPTAGTASQLYNYKERKTRYLSHDEALSSEQPNRTFPAKLKPLQNARNHNS